MQNRLRSLVLPLLIVAVVYAAIGIVLRCWYEVSSGVLDGDAQIFQTVGRGIVNGLTPYIDLFETKPPGVFLMHAASLALFGNQLLVKLLEAGVFLVLPFLIAIPAIQSIADRPAVERRILSMLSLLFGMIVTLYTANQAGAGLAESYGALFAVLYVFLVVHGSPSRKTVLLLGVVLLCAVGFKEPFLLSIFAGVLLLHKRIVSSFVLPVSIAAPLGVLALTVFGMLGPFFTIYLRHMLGYHIHQHDGSTLLHALEIWRTFVNMGAYSWCFAIAITILWVAMGFWHMSVRYGIASYLMFLAIAVGGDFYGHHFIFAVPVYVVLYWLAVRQEWVGRMRHIPVLFGVLLVCTALLNTHLSYRDAADAWRSEEAQMRSIAETVDHVMDDCNWEKYLQMIPRGGGPYAFTRHSPYGPIFIHYSRFIGANKMYQSRHIHALQTSPLILIRDVENSNLTDVAMQYLGVRYGEDPPSCVGDWYTPPEPYHLLFKKEVTAK